jgi:hypothetical protein
VSSRRCFGSETVSQLVKVIFPALTNWRLSEDVPQRGRPTLTRTLGHHEPGEAPWGLTGSGAEFRSGINAKNAPEASTCFWGVLPCGCRLLLVESVEGTPCVCYGLVTCAISPRKAPKTSWEGVSTLVWIHSLIVVTRLFSRQVGKE